MRFLRTSAGWNHPGGHGLSVGSACCAAAGRGAATVVLDRVQDAGNVGSILRSASAFGFRQVLAVKGGVRPVVAKVLRAGMGPTLH